MYCIIKNNIVVGTCNVKPCHDDLASRNEIAIEDNTAAIGWLFTNGELKPPIPVVPTKEQLLEVIRGKRDSLLFESDKYMLSDFPTGGLSRDEWVAKVITYRQTLRDFPETCDPQNPVFPTL